MLALGRNGCCVGFRGTYSIGLEILLPFVCHNLCELVRMGNVKIGLPRPVYNVLYYCFFLSMMGPAKSNCSSSLGSLNLGSVPNFDLLIMGFSFLPWSKHCLQFSALRAIVLCIWGTRPNSLI